MFKIALYGFAIFGVLSAAALLLLIACVLSAMWSIAGDDQRGEVWEQSDRVRMGHP